MFSFEYKFDPSGVLLRLVCLPHRPSHWTQVERKSPFQLLSSSAHITLPHEALARWLVWNVLFGPVLTHMFPLLDTGDIVQLVIVWRSYRASL